MSGLIAGGGKSLSTSETKIEALKLQSSAYGVVIPVAYGVTRIPGNLVWYGGFQAIPHTTSSSAGKGGGVKTTQTTYTYQASVEMALCEGPIAAVPRVWRGKKMYDGGLVPGNLKIATEEHTISAQGLVTLNNDNVRAIKFAHILVEPDESSYYVSEGGGFTRDDDELTFDARYNGLDVQVVYQYDDGVSGTDGLDALGLSLFKGDIGQAPWTYLSTNHANEAIGYSGITLVAGEAYDLGAGAQVENHNFEVVGPMAYSIDASTPDAEPSMIFMDVLTNSRFGAGFPAEKLASVDQWANYCLSAGILLSPSIKEQIDAVELIDHLAKITNTNPVWVDGRLHMVPLGDETLTDNGATYTPDLTPVYDLVEGDFVGEEPVKHRRKRAADAFNHVRVEFLNREHDYNVEISEAKDQASIDAHGIRTMPTVKAHWICDANVARNVSQLLLQRALYVRNAYSFTVPWTKSLLCPMSIVTLTEPSMQLDREPVIITKIEENEDGDLTIDADEYLSGVASAAKYNTTVGSGYIPNFNATPGNARVPVIFEMPGALSTTGLEIAIAASGASPNWGGCEVWASYEGDSYTYIGTLNGPSRHGTLNGPFVAGNVSVHMDSGQLWSVVVSENGVVGTLCYVGGTTQEFIAFENATFNGGGNYTLSQIARGAYETTITAHTAGDTFVRVDDAVAVSAPLDQELIGKVIRIKLLSFNIYGGAMQSLADVDPHLYTVTGAFVGTRAGVRTYLQETEPENPLVGDLWTVPSTGETKRWTGAVWELFATIGADENTFYGIVGIGNLLRKGSFRFDGDADGVADGWAKSVGNDVVTATRVDSGGMFGGDSQKLTWANTPLAPYGIVSNSTTGGVVGGWRANTSYMVSGYVKGSAGGVGSCVSLSWNNSPATVTWLTDREVASEFERVAARVSWGSSVESNGGLTMVAQSASNLGSIEFSALQVTQGTILTEYVESVEDIRAAAAAAQVTADDAAAAAATALAEIGSTVSDNLIVPSEKRNLIITYNRTVDERANIVAMAADFNVSSSTYNTAVNGLVSYMATLTSNVPWHNLSGSTTVDGATFKVKWTDVFTSRQDLLNAVTSNARTRADTAQSTASNAAANAGNAIQIANDAADAAAAAEITANAASATANQALAEIGVSVSDNTLTPAEKRGLIIEYGVITAEQSGIETQAAAYSITTERSNYNGSVANLTSYLNGLTTPVAWNSLSGSTTVVGSTFLAKWQDVYTKRQALLDKITEKARDLANSAQSAANNASANANTALSNANLALSNASAASASAATAVALFANFSSDNVLVPGEKPPIVLEVSRINTEVPQIQAQAQSYAITTEQTNFNSSHSNLTNHLATLTSPVLWSNLSGNTDIVGTTFRGKFADYYAKREALLLRIAAIAGTRATWAGILDVPYESIRNNLIDPSWWKPGATFLWNKQEDVAGETSIVWGSGPKNNLQAMIKCLSSGSNGGPGGGWAESANGSANSFLIDPTKTYRFAVPLFVQTKNVGSYYWGPQALWLPSVNTICAINSSNAVENPYFVALDRNDLSAGRWYLFVGYIFPAGSTGTSSDSAGAWDMATGAKVASGVNFCWASNATYASTRAFQYYNDPGAECYFGHPMVHLVNGAEPSLNDMLQGAAILNSQQEWSDVKNVDVTTGDIAPWAATEVITVTGAGPYGGADSYPIGASGALPTVVGPFPVDTRLIVSLTASVAVGAPSVGSNRLRLRIAYDYEEIFSSVPPWYTALEVPASQNDTGSVSLTRELLLSANTQATVVVQAINGRFVAPYGLSEFSDVVMCVQAVKR